jgi:hypothetical protein
MCFRVCNYSVSGSHLYGEEGASYNFTIIVMDDGGKTATITGTATVGDADLTGVTAATASGGVEGMTAATLSGATFTDAAGTYGSLSDFSVKSVAWGDGSTDATGLSIGGSGGSYSVSGSHSYSEEGTSYNFTIIVMDDGGKTATITGTASVTDPQLTSLGDAHLPNNGTEGTAIGSITGIATFTDPGGAEAVGDYTATINWGDNKTDTGTVVATQGNNFRVDAPSHTYAEEGTFTETVTIKHDALASVTTTGQMIAISDPFSYGKYPNVNGLLSGDSITLTRSFSDPVSTDGPWSVTVNDGKSGDPVQTFSSITSPQSFTFTLSYTVTVATTFTVTVTVSDGDGDAHAAKTFTVSVDTPQLVVGGAAVSNVATTALTQQQLKPVAAAAIGAWAAAGVSAAQLNRLSQTPIQIVDLQGAMVGGTNPAGIQIDPTAAGHGWFVDPTLKDRPAPGRVDLLTVLEHEMGNMLGFPETQGNDIMGKFLAVGVRRFADAGTVAGVIGGGRSSVAIGATSESTNPAAIAPLAIIPSDLVADVASLNQPTALVTGRKKGH